MDDLVKRLRAINQNYELARGVHCDIREAADRIEQLEARVAAADRLTEACRDLGGYPREIAAALAAYEATKEQSE